MNGAPVETGFAHLIAAAAATAARRELALVRSAVTSREANALAQAFFAHRKYLACLMGWSEARIDFYCVARLQRFAAQGIPSVDLEFIQAATEQIIEMTKGDL